MHCRQLCRLFPSIKVDACLGEVIAYLKLKDGHRFPEFIYQDLIKMVAVNVFVRTLPPSRAEDPDEEDSPPVDPSWPHMQVSRATLNCKQYRIQ